MKVLRSLKMTLFGRSEATARDLRTLATAAAAMAGFYWAGVGVFEWYTSAGCFRQVLAKFPSVSGYDFEVHTQDCWHTPETSVFVSKPGRSKKTRLFLYHSDDAATISSIDQHTIRISLGDISSISCRTYKWKDLTITYDIQRIQYPSDDDFRECKS